MEKPSFRRLRAACRFDIDTLAFQAGVGPVVVFRMLEELPVPRKDAEKVLAAYSEHVMQGSATYTLENVEVVLSDEQ